MNDDKRKVVNYNDFQKVLTENNSPEACQYLESLWDAYTAYMPISFELAMKAAEKIVIGETEFIANMTNQMNKQFADGNSVACYSPKISDFPKNLCNFEGLEIRAELMFKKSIYDFFHWARMCMELPTQLINAALLGNESVKIENTKLSAIIKEKISSKNSCINLLKMIDAATMSAEYKYVNAFDNCSKHIKLIPIKINTVQISFGEKLPPKFTIEAFSYKGKKYHEEDALEKIDKVEEHIRTSIYQMLIEIQTIVQEVAENEQ